MIAINIDGDEFQKNVANQQVVYIEALLNVVFDKILIS